MRDFTVIIPTWNMGRYLEPLFQSIVDSDFSSIVEEVLFVCEKSTDGSESIIESISKRQNGKLPRVRMIQPEQRRGLFIARYLGAKAANTKKIMFIDSRITLPQKTGASLPYLASQYPAMSSVVDIDVKKNVYCLYWQRSHETIFKSTARANATTITTVTSNNFHSHRIGGTCFYCSREPFVALSEKYLDQPLFSDDTYLMEDLVRVEPFTVHPDFRIDWEPRDTAMVFLKHLYGRGPGFAQYNLFHRRGALFYAIVTGVVFLLATLLVSFVSPLTSLIMLTAAIVTLMLSTAFISRSLGDFIRLAPLHTAVILFYGFGALRGSWIVYKRSGFASPGAPKEEGL